MPARILGMDVGGKDWNPFESGIEKNPMQCYVKSGLAVVSVLYKVTEG